MEKVSDLTLQSIGSVEKNNGTVQIKLDGEYSDGLNGLDGFGHVVVIWWADRFVEYRNQIDMIIDLPYAPGTKAGLFATRSPVRPNPVCVSTAEIKEISTKDGVLVIDEIDAAHETPVLDIKPYYGTTDRVEEYRQPAWVPDEWPVWRIPIGEENYGEE